MHLDTCKPHMLAVEVVSMLLGREKIPWRFDVHLRPRRFRVRFGKLHVIVCLRVMGSVILGTL